MNGDSERCATMKDKSKLLEWLKQSRVTGMLLAACSGLAFTVSNFLVQVAHHHSNVKIPAMQFVLARSCVQSLAILPFIIAFKINLRFLLKEVPTYLTMSVTGCMNIMLIYYALDCIPIADTLVITFTSPFFSCIFGRLILKERVHWFDCLCGLVSFTGVVVVSRPSFIFGQAAHAKQVLFQMKHLSKRSKEIIYLQGVGFAFLGGISLALYFVTTRAITRKASPVVCIFYPSMVGVMISLAIMLLGRDWFVISSKLVPNTCMIMVGVTSLLALAFLSLALKLENATVVNLVRNIDVVYAFVFQYFAFGVQPNVWNGVGSAVIIGGTSLIVVRKWWQEYQSVCAEKQFEYAKIASKP